jgi:hypothetical protein
MLFAATMTHAQYAAFGIFETGFIVVASGDED